MRTSALLLIPLITLGVTGIGAQCISDGSFESSSSGGPPGSPWSVSSGGFAVVETTPTAFLPSDGNKYLRIAAVGTGPATPGHGPHTGVAKVSQNFTVPPHEYFALSVDWEFIQVENTPSSYNDFVSIDILTQAITGPVLVANVLYVDTGHSGGTPDAYTNAPGGGAGELAFVPNQTIHGASGDENPAPAGFKRAWIDLTGIVNAGSWYTLEISIGNGGDDQYFGHFLIDNVRCLVAERNGSSYGLLRILGASHPGGLTPFYWESDGLADTPFELDTMPSQRITFRHRGGSDDPFALFAGDLVSEGTYFPPVGTVNLSSPIAIIDGIAPGGGDDWIGTTIGGESYIEARVGSTTPLGTKIAFQTVMIAPPTPSGLELSAATEVRVGASGAPRVPLGTSGLGLPNNGSAMLDFATEGFSSGNWDFYGTSWTRLYVNSNGNITFGSGDTGAYEGGVHMLQDEPRLAVLWDDLYPQAGHNVSYSATSQTFTVSWDGVREYQGYPFFGNWLAIQMYTDGQFTFYYGGTTMSDGLVGISPGGLSVPSSYVDLSNEDWSDLDGALGNRQYVGSNSAKFERYEYTDNGGWGKWKSDIITIGNGICRIHFVPEPGGGYAWFAGGR
jgi:hypothetical protein